MTLCVRMSIALSEDAIRAQESASFAPRQVRMSEVQGLCKRKTLLIQPKVAEQTNII